MHLMPPSYESPENCISFSAHQNRCYIKTTLLCQEYCLATSFNNRVYCCPLLRKILILLWKLLSYPTEINVERIHLMMQEMLCWSPKWFAEIGIWMTLTLHFVIKSSSNVWEDIFFPLCISFCIYKLVIARNK